MSTQNDAPIEKHDSILSLIVRTFWMLIGNVILLFSIIAIMQRKNWAFRTADVVFWSAAAALILARYLDIKFYGGSTATGQPASMAHWRKYAIVILICSAVVWVLAHAVIYLNK